MARPTNDEREDIMLALIEQLGDCIRDLHEIDRGEDADCVLSIMNDLNREVSRISSDIERDEQAEEDSMVCEYWKSVM